MKDLLNFRKPGQYIGHEWNVVEKKVTQDMAKVCVCFPEGYDLGMSTLGLRILYGLFNQDPAILCDRSFLPQDDYQGYLREHSARHCSVQCAIPLSDFDLLGFTLNYELNYVHFLKMLALSGIPLRADQRDKPIVGIGGCANPLVVSDFIDFCFLGEIEAAPAEFMEAVRLLPRLSKKDFLDRIAGLPGIYVPARTQQYPLSKVYTRSLDSSFYPVDWLVPYVGIVHDRAYVEVARGCPRTCAFCQARCMYYPYRERSAEQVISLVRKIYEKTGYEDISLLSLSVSDYSGIEPVLKELISSLGKYGVKISLPSLRATDVAGSLSSLVSQIKKSGLTIAVETVSESLRQKICKPIDHQALYASLENAVRAGYRHLKFYFMLGLPGETQEDVALMMDFIRQTNRFLTQRNRSIEVSINFSHFIPKPFSTLENESMHTYEALRAKTEYAYQSLKAQRNIHISVSSCSESIVEGVLSRGDARLGSILEYFLRENIPFSQQHVDFLQWEEACGKFGIDYGAYIYEKQESHGWDIFKR